MKKTIQKTALLATSTFGLLATSTSSALAQAQGGASQANLPSPLRNVNLGSMFGFNSIQNTINSVIAIILWGAGLAAFLFILWGAFNYVTAGDSADKTEKARKTITNAVVGLILVALAFVVWQIAVSLVGLDGLFAQP